MCFRYSLLRARNCHAGLLLVGIGTWRKKQKLLLAWRLEDCNRKEIYMEDFFLLVIRRILVEHSIKFPIKMILEV